MCLLFAFYVYDGFRRMPWLDYTGIENVCYDESNYDSFAFILSQIGVGKMFLDTVR